RRLLGPCVVEVNVSPETVIRPGDTVLLCVPGAWNDRETIRRKARENWLPTGAEIVVFCGPGAEALDLTRFAKSLLDNLGDRGADGRSKHDAPEPFAPHEEPAASANNLAQGLLNNEQLASVPVLVNVDVVPEPSSEPSDGP